MSDFGSRLKYLRQSKNLTQKQLAIDVGASESGIQNYELGTRKPNYDMIIALSKYFKVPTDYLLGQGFFEDWNLIIANKKVIIDVVNQYIKLPDAIDLNNVSEGSLMSFLSAIIDHVEFENGEIQVFLRTPI